MLGGVGGFLGPPPAVGNDAILFRRARVKRYIFMDKGDQNRYLLMFRRKPSRHRHGLLAGRRTISPGCPAAPHTTRPPHVVATGRCMPHRRPPKFLPCARYRVCRDCRCVGSVPRAQRTATRHPRRGSSARLGQKQASIALNSNDPSPRSVVGAPWSTTIVLTECLKG